MNARFRVLGIVQAVLDRMLELETIISKGPLVKMSRFSWWASARHHRAGWHAQKCLLRFYHSQIRGLSLEALEARHAVQAAGDEDNSHKQSGFVFSSVNVG
jgi:hypothetical protein